jgi:hypothetical protein
VTIYMHTICKADVRGHFLFLPTYCKTSWYHIKPDVFEQPTYFVKEMHYGPALCSVQSHTVEKLKEINSS